MHSFFRCDGLPTAVPDYILRPFGPARVEMVASRREFGLLTLIAMLYRYNQGFLLAGAQNGETLMLRLLLHWLLSAIALLLVSRIVPGIFRDRVASALIAALVIGLLNATVGLLLKIITFPISILTLGMFLLVINAAHDPGGVAHGAWLHVSTDWFRHSGARWCLSFWA